MIRVEIELSRSGQFGDVLSIANWVCATLGEERSDIVVHRVTVEEADA